MPWEKEVITPEYHVDRAKEFLKKKEALGQNVANNFYDLALVCCELGILALGDKATASLTKAAGELREKGKTSLTAYNLVAGIEAAMKAK